jgi:thiamine biosynthesis lipoprotein
MKTTVRHGRSMGSTLRLTLAGSRDSEIDAAWKTVAEIFDRAELDLTRFDQRSALNRLNQSPGEWVKVPATLRRALTAAWRAFRVSGGRFDPRIIGALEASGERAGIRLPPSPCHLSPADRWLRLDRRGFMASVTAPIDLGGIGKGLALRWAATGLRRCGTHDFLLSAGGDLVASGRGPANAAWLVGLEDPTGARSPLATIELRDAALATSSTAVHPRHLIDPATLRPVDPAWSSVTVLDRDPAWAEVWSKVAFLGGADVGPPRAVWRVRRGGELSGPAPPTHRAPARTLHATLIPRYRRATR